MLYYIIYVCSVTTLIKYNSKYIVYRISAKQFSSLTICTIRSNSFTLLIVVLLTDTKFKNIRFITRRVIIR